MEDGDLQLPPEYISDERQLRLLIEQAYKFKKTIVRAHDEVDEKFREMINSQNNAEEQLRAHVLCGGELPLDSEIRIARVSERTTHSVDAKMLLTICELLEHDGNGGISAMIRRCITTSEREATTQLRYHG